MKKLGKRTILRIQAMKILFIADIDEISVDEALANAKGGILDNDEINENSEITEDAIKLLEYINDNLDKIDALISDTLVNYTIERLNTVDKAIVRLATAELMLKELDKKIIIDEALEITKLYSDTGDHKAVSFNNRLLDNISKKI
ncbi:MAG: transcription antitermination protein NusB [Acholeplasmatales bacterium]|nr:transcription antitermination protein NusB [Acholeplasmatales bacterium]